MATRSTTAPGAASLARIWRDYSLSVVVAGLFAGSFILLAVFSWLQYAADQDLGAPATLFGLHGFLTYLGEWTFQNWRSEFLEVLVLIVLTSYLVHKGSPVSKDRDEEIRRAVARIERKLHAVAGDQDRSK
jgi:hypothetical protein